MPSPIVAQDSAVALSDCPVSVAPSSTPSNAIRNARSVHVAFLGATLRASDLSQSPTPTEKQVTLAVGSFVSLRTQSHLSAAEFLWNIVAHSTYHDIRHDALCVADSRACKNREERRASINYICKVSESHTTPPVLQRSTLAVAKLASGGGVEPEAASQSHGAVCLLSQCLLR